MPMLNVLMPSDIEINFKPKIVRYCALFSVHHIYLSKLQITKIKIIFGAKKIWNKKKNPDLCVQIAYPTFPYISLCMGNSISAIY